MKIVEGLKQRKHLDWIAYEKFVENVILTSQADAEAPFLAMNLMRDFNDRFALLKKKMLPVIQNVHMNLTTNTNPAAVKSEEGMIKFIKDTYGIDIVKLGKSLS